MEKIVLTLLVQMLMSCVITSGHCVSKLYILQQL
jgi:hypothetical protein